MTAFCSLCGNTDAADLGEVIGICLDKDACHRRQLKMAEARGAAAMRERVLEILDRGKVEWFIHLLDLIDQLMVSRGMDTGPEMQDDLRRLLALIDPKETAGGC